MRGSMKRILALILCLSFATPSFAMQGVLSGRMAGSVRGNYAGGRTALPIALPDGVTFYADYEKGNSTDANAVFPIYSAGSPTSTFTTTRSATNSATYIDASGVIRQVTSSDTPRINSCLYDSTGLLTNKRGLMIESSGTNLLSYSYFNTTDFNVSGDSIKTTDTTTRYSIVKANSGSGSWSLTSGGVYQGFATYTVTNDGTVGDSDLKIRTASTFAVASGSTYTVSFYVKSNKTGNYAVVLLDATDNSTTRGTGNITISTANVWVRVIVSITASADDNCKLEIYIGNKGDDTVFSFDCIQSEGNSYATSYIPTTTASATRGTTAEVLKYLNAGNRTAAQETIFIKFIPFGNFANDGVNRVLLDSDTKSRRLDKGTSASVLRYYSNLNDSGLSVVYSNTTNSSNTSYVVGVASYGTDAATNTSIFTNGSLDTTPSTENYTAPAWGSYFYIGSYNSSNSQLNGIIQKVLIYNRALSASEVLTVSTWLANN